MRHTFATKAIAKGMRPKSLQKILGHSNLAITMNLYCHVESESLKEQMSLLDEMVQKWCQTAFDTSKTPYFQHVNEIYE